MGFHKRIINQENLFYYIEHDQLDDIFSADCLIFEDEISNQIFDLYQKDTDICDIRKNFENYGKGVEVTTI
jgi:hypothetical protein